MQSFILIAIGRNYSTSRGASPFLSKKVSINRGANNINIFRELMQNFFFGKMLERTGVCFRFEKGREFISFALFFFVFGSRNPIIILYSF